MDAFTATPSPSARETYNTLVRVGAKLDLELCWLHGRRYYFSLGEGWSLVVTPEPAMRYRIEACLWMEPKATRWAPAADDGRLIAQVTELHDEVLRVRAGAF